MSVAWTKEQQKVIDVRDRNVLVSAAAGSGKTAVLVEHIVQKVLDPGRPVDIDRMLIVTFTKAAAAEMRERVGNAIEARMEIEPDNAFLQRQYTLVHNAQITTIDSFCLYVVRNYFQTIGLEPSFRIGDPGELQLLQGDVMEEVLEEHYAKKDAGFLQLVDHYATAKSDKKLAELALRLYEFSQSYPWPKEWLASLDGGYQAEEFSQLEQKPWMVGLLQYLDHVFTGMKHRMEYAHILCKDPDGPANYLSSIEEDLDALASLLSCKTYEDYAACLLVIEKKPLGRIKKGSCDEEKQELVKSLHTELWKLKEKVVQDYFFQSSKELLCDMQRIRPDVQALSSLVLAFTHSYEEKKQERNLLDFSDVEHLALRILINEQTKEPTAAALELQECFDEIMIDEYQDSNYVQETILRAVSREQRGQNNIFMVGDVKQSIYRFRLARPELFMEKYKTYTVEDSPTLRIDLHKNFRSRSEVVDSVNRIFQAIMQEDLGNVAYDESARLNCGADYLKPPKPDSFITELLFLSEEGAAYLTGQGIDSVQEQEARMVASRIRELLTEQLVTDKATGKLREARYSDIVILLRSVSGWADTFSRVLSEEGIPAHTTSMTGYFGTIEIRTILSMLSILDNPLQDIPMAAVLASPIGGFDGEELARIKVASKEKFYYLALEQYGEAGEDEALREKIRCFLQLFEGLRALTPYTPIHELIRCVLDRTDYASYLQAMPSGAQRRANMDMLLEKAMDYEKTSYKGLFHFVQYIEKLKKYQVDFGEADITSENDNVVRIMSIHKSKGLEFPIVFVSGMSKQFNQQDVRSAMQLHPEYGIGLDCIDSERRTKRPGLLKKILSNQICIDNQGEELRILYVALTRAKEKLIMTSACLPKEEPSGGYEPGSGAIMDYLSRYKASCYLDWVYPIVAADRILFRQRIVSKEELELSQAVEAASGRLDQFRIRELAKTADEAMVNQIDRQLSWHYAYASDTELKTKISVSELKRRAMVLSEEEQETPVQELFRTEKKELVPRFLQTAEDTKAGGALRGSAVHKVMEEIDFVRIRDSRHRLQELILQIDEMLAHRHITEEMRGLVNPKRIAGFFDSPIARQMADAQEQGQLFKEQPFVMGIPANQIYEGTSEELVLIQGIVDAYWVEPDGITILDYKTDSVKTGEELKKRYAIQLRLYGEALQKATGCAIKHLLMYSFHLNEVVEVAARRTCKKNDDL